MKSLRNSALHVIILLLSIVSFPLFGQSVRETVRDELPAFSRITLGGDFSMDIRYGKQYAATLGVENLLADYVLFSVMDSTLTVSLDERRVPAEVRKLYRGKDAATPTLNLVVTMPETLRLLRLEDRSVLLSADDLVVDPDGLRVEVTDQARVASFAFGSGCVDLNLDRKGSVKMNVTCDSLHVRQAGNSNLELTYHTQVCAFELNGSCTLAVAGETELMKLDSKGFSKSILNGKAPVVRYKLANSSQVNATMLEAGQAFVEMAGLGTLTQAASESLTVDLSGGATVYFLNDPAIHVLYLKNASLIPYDRK